MDMTRRGLRGRVALFAFSLVVGAGLYLPAAAEAQQKYKFVFVIHSSGPDLWNGVLRRGMADAAAQLNVEATMLYAGRYDDAAAQVAVLEGALLEKPDGIVTSIIHPTVFNRVLEKALGMGVPVVAANTNALIGSGHPLERRIPYVGATNHRGGYELVKHACEQYFRDKSKIRALVGVEAPGASWADERAQGAIEYLEQNGIPYEKLDIGQHAYMMQSRVAEYLRKNPVTTLVISQGGAGPVGTAAGVRDAGRKPGEVVVVGYDLFQQTVQEIKDGYVTLVADQHTYLQGYLPVIELYLIKELAMSPFSVDTGLSYVDRENVDQVNALIGKGVR